MGQGCRVRPGAGGPALPPTPPRGTGPRPPTLTLLIGLIDGPDFGVGPSGQDFDESLFVCAGSLEGQGKEDLNHSPDPRTEARRAQVKETPAPRNHAGGQRSDQAFPNFLFTLRCGPQTRPWHDQGTILACKDFQNLP